MTLGELGASGAGDGRLGAGAGLDVAALALAVLATAVSLAGVPLQGWHDLLADPCHRGAAAVPLVLLAALAARTRRGGRGAAERSVFAAFLAGMPLVYLDSWWAAGGRQEPAAWLGLELLGLAVFGALAWMGWRRSGWFLAGGIALHGLGWDLWHYAHATYVPAWYVSDCLIVDLGFACYVAVRTRAWGSQGAAGSAGPRSGASAAGAASMRRSESRK